MMRLRFFLALSILVFMACGGEEFEDNDVTGSWHGATNAEQVFRVNIARDGSLVSGSGLIENGNIAGRDFAVTVTGTFSTEDGFLAITLDTGGSGSVAYNAFLTDHDRLDGALSGAGWNNTPLVLRR